MNQVDVRIKSLDSDTTKLNWTATDLAFLQSKRSINRLRQAKFHHLPDVHIVIEIGEKFGSDRKRDPEFEEPGKVVFIYRNNVNDKRTKKMLTPWIAAHRVMHAIQGRKAILDIRDNQDVLEDYNRAIRLLHAAYGFESSRCDMWGLYWNLPRGTKEFNAWQELCYQVFTMRSARTRGWPFAEEATAETFAQYLITGRVTLNELPQRVGVLNKVTATTAKEIEDLINSAYAKLTAAMPGQVFAF